MLKNLKDKIFKAFSKTFKIVKRYRHVLFFIFVIGFFIDLFLPPKGNELFGLFLFFIAIISVISFDLTARLTSIIMFLLLLLSASFLIVGYETGAEKSAIWAFLFLIITSVQHLVKTRKQLASL